MSHQRERRDPQRIKVQDRRGSAAVPKPDVGFQPPETPEESSEAGARTGDEVLLGEVVEDDGAPDAGREDSEDDVAAELERLRAENEGLRYHLAEAENRRKRMIREQTEALERASKRLVGELLVVLDNFDRAIEHAEDPSGLEIVRKELLRVLGQEGLEEIEAQGLPFDYHVHEAMASHEDPAATKETVSEVYRKGYRLKDLVLRPAQVVVARPPEDAQSVEG